MHVFAGLDVARGVADRHAVFDDVLAGLDGTTGVLVPVRADFDVVGRMDDHRDYLSFHSRTPPEKSLRSLTARRTNLATTGAKDAPS